MKKQMICPVIKSILNILDDKETFREKLKEKILSLDEGRHFKVLVGDKVKTVSREIGTRKIVVS